MYFYLKRISLCFLFSLMLSISLHAQTIPKNVESLTDEELIEFYEQFELDGLSQEELLKKATELGITPTQLSILKSRYQNIQEKLKQKKNNTISTDNENLLNSDKELDKKDINKKKPLKKENKNALPIFGEEIFSNQLLNFEPDLKTPTPKNYIIGVSDELTIDIFGVSEISKKIKVNNDGNIRYPNYGPINIAGLTLDEAELKIKSNLSKIYSGLNNGTTKLKINLNNNRGINIKVIGQANFPGNYTISAYSTIMNALFNAGGPNKIGSYRNIDLVRSGKIIVTFDLYSFILHGDLKNNLVLKDEDIIYIHPYLNRVSLTGAVKKPAIYELKSNEYLENLMDFSSGIAAEGVKNKVQIKRFGITNKEIIIIDLTQFNQFKLFDGDIINVDKINERFKNKVSITGSVAFPGEYSVEKCPTLSDLLKLAQILEGAYIDRASIFRKKLSDFSPAYTEFNVADIMNLKSNLNLQREDSIVIYKKLDILESQNITISGEVNKPNVYNFYDGLKLKDIILLAGGLKYGASNKKIEVARRLKLENLEEPFKYATIYNKSVENEQNIAGEEFELQPFDIITIRNNPVYKQQQLIEIKGEVLYPGFYTIETNHEKILNVINRAGGLKSEANIKGISLLRLSNEANSNIKDNYKNKIKKDGITSGKKINDSFTNIFQNDQTYNSVGIHFDKVLMDTNCADNLELLDKDIIVVPKSTNTMTISGAVNSPKKILFYDGIKYKKAIQFAGGYSLKAYKKQGYVIYQNGEVSTVKNFLFFKHYPKLEKGCEILVIEKNETKQLTLVEQISLISTVTSLLAIIFAVINNLKK